MLSKNDLHCDQFYRHIQKGDKSLYEIWTLAPKPDKADKPYSEDPQPYIDYLACLVQGRRRYYDLVRKPRHWWEEKKELSSSETDEKNKLKKYLENTPYAITTN